MISYSIIHEYTSLTINISTLCHAFLTKIYKCSLQQCYSALLLFHSVCIFPEIDLIHSAVSSVVKKFHPLFAQILDSTSIYVVVTLHYYCRNYIKIMLQLRVLKVGTTVAIAWPKLYQINIHKWINLRQL
jgi:hypothetical protein